MNSYALSDVLSLSRDEVELQDAERYETVGIYSYGRGLFRRPEITGAETTYRSYFRLRAGQFVYSRLFGWEGALAVVGEDFDGLFVSPEFPTFEIDTSRMLPDYMSLLCRWKPLWDALASGESGLGGRRKRVHPKHLLAVEVPLPDLGEQKRIVDLISTFDLYVSSITVYQDRLISLKRAIIEQEIEVSGSTNVTFDDIADINSESVARDVEHEFQYVDLASVDAHRGIDLGALALHTRESAPSRARRVIRSSDVLVSTVRPYLRGFALVPNELDGHVASTGFAVLRSKEGVALPGFIWAVTQTNRFVDWLVERSAGSGYPAVRASDVAAFSISLPTLKEQERISELALAFERALRLTTRLHGTSTRAGAHLRDSLLAGSSQIDVSYDAIAMSA